MRSSPLSARASVLVDRQAGGRASGRTGGRTGGEEFPISLVRGKRTNPRVDHHRHRNPDINDGFTNDLSANSSDWIMTLFDVF